MCVFDAAVQFSSRITKVGPAEGEIIVRVPTVVVDMGWLPKRTLVLWEVPGNYFFVILCGIQLENFFA